ncbi:MAG: hypothetical protein M1831_002042 [Alyxoria varia]|nr:MAG: hypothetical protein M1831_002042 [Alyxoria varia]
MEESDSSPLSSPPLSEEEMPQAKPVLRLVKGKLSTSKKPKSPSTSPEPNLTLLGRDPSPRRDYGLADNPDIAFIVMFRSRFHNAFPKSVANLGPQDIEDGVAGTSPSEQVENLLCGLLGLVLNRKKYVERGHHGRALEEALSTNKNQWPHSWNGINPLAGSKTFESMNAEQRLNLLRALILWSLNSSEQIVAMIKESYKQSRHDDDLNQPLFVPPWGIDSLKRNFYLIEGQTDTPFRIYREAGRKTPNPTWRSVAGTIEETQNLARDLRAEKAQAAHRLAGKIQSAVPLLEERQEVNELQAVESKQRRLTQEQKRRRKEYRQARKAQFTRPDTGFSLYEGRTRGKRMKYTFDDDDEEEGGTDATSNRRSGRQTGTSTPAQGPTFTASGRQVRSQHGRSYGDSSRNLRGRAGDTSGRGSPLDDEDELAGDDAAIAPRGDGRARRSSAAHANGKARDGRHIAGYNSIDAEHSESDEPSSGKEWDGDDNDFDGKMDEDEDEDMSEADDDSLGEEDDITTGSKIVSLKIGKQGLNAATSTSKDAQIDESPDPLAEENPLKLDKSMSRSAESATGLAKNFSAAQQAADHTATPLSDQENNIVLGTSKAPGASSPTKPMHALPGQSGGQSTSKEASNGITGNANPVQNGTAANISSPAVDSSGDPAIATTATFSAPLQGGDIDMNCS